jgi:hypothetical protein
MSYSHSAAMEQRIVSLGEIAASKRTELRVRVIRALEEGRGHLPFVQRGQGDRPDRECSEHIAEVLQDLVNDQQVCEALLQLFGGGSPSITLQRLQFLKETCARRYADMHALNLAELEYQRG